MDAIVSCKQLEYRPSLRPAVVLYKYTDGSTQKKEGSSKKRNEDGRRRRIKEKITNKQKNKKKKKFMELFSNEMKRNPQTDRQTDIKLNTD